MAGIVPGMSITAVNGVNVKKTDDLDSLADKVMKDKILVLDVSDGRQKRRISIKLF